MLEEAARERIVARFANEALDPNQPTNPNQPTPTNQPHQPTTPKKARVSKWAVSQHSLWRERDGRGGEACVHAPEGAIACRGRWCIRPGWGTCTAHTWARIDRASRCGSRPYRRTPPPRARRSRQSCADRWRRPNGTAARTRRNAPHGGVRVLTLRRKPAAAGATFKTRARWKARRKRQRPCANACQTPPAVYRPRAGHRRRKAGRQHHPDPWHSCPA